MHSGWLKKTTFCPIVLSVNDPWLRFSHCHLTRNVPFSTLYRSLVSCNYYDKLSNIILHILSTSMSLYYFEWKCPSLAVKSVVILLKCLASSAKKWPLRSKCSSLPQDGWSESCEKPINIASKWWCIQRAKHPKHDLIITLKSLQLSSYPKFYTIYCDAKG